MKKLFYIFCIASIIVGCARMGSPDGGWYDDDPPRVIGATPEDKATNVKSKKITILFDEFIKLEDAPVDENEPVILYEKDLFNK